MADFEPCDQKACYVMMKKSVEKNVLCTLSSWQLLRYHDITFSFEGRVFFVVVKHFQVGFMLCTVEFAIHGSVHLKKDQVSAYAV